jgi:hypothetical protein
LVPDAHRGYHHAPGLRTQETGVLVTTNSRGMRGSREYSVPKPEAVVRVVALGDSFTFGVGVPDDATWPAQLEAALPGSEVVNLGEPAYAHDQMYFALSDEGLKLEPDVVIVGFYPNDVVRDELTFYCAEKPRFTLGAEGWHVENVPVPLPWDVHDHYRELPLVYAIPRALIEASLQPSIDERTGEERATEILRRMRKLVEAAGARFLLVHLPDQPDAPPNTSGFFHEFCAKTGTECVDPWPRFRETAGTDDSAALRARYRRPNNDIHYSRAGYAVVAEALRLHFTAHPIVPGRERAAGVPPH